MVKRSVGGEIDSQEVLVSEEVVMIGDGVIEGWSVPEYHQRAFRCRESAGEWARLDEDFKNGGQGSSGAGE